MFKVTKVSDGRVDLEISGTIDTQAMETGLDALIAHSDEIENGVMLYTITNFTWPGLGAIGVELSRLPKLFGLLGKFDKCAVLSDASWLRTAAEVEGKIIPGLAIKAFELDERAAAEAWLEKV